MDDEDKIKFGDNDYLNEFMLCLFDDLNTPRALSILNNQISMSRESEGKEKNYCWSPSFFH